MRNKLLVLSILAIVLGDFQSASAQVAFKTTPELEAKRMTKVMAKRLYLSQDQKEKVLNLNLELANKEKQLLNADVHGGKFTFWEQQKRLKEIPDIREKKMKEILNDQQYKKYYNLNHRTRKDTASD